ncbi:enoyl-CoA hydratase-related protein [Thermaurantiacus sp.]
MLKVATDTRGVARVALDRPEKHNAFDAALVGALAEAFTRLGADPAVRVILLSGHGPSFCAGADANWMRAQGALSQAENQADAMRLSDMLAAIDACPKAVIVSAHGNVFGGGVGLVACADLAVAATATRFRLSEVRLGLTPATISPFVIAKAGASAARAWFVSGMGFGAEGALQAGLVHAVSDDPGAVVEAWIADILAAAPGAIAEAKALVRDIAGQPITDTLRAETAARIAARRASDEGREGLAAFLEKRPPAWAKRA